MAADRTKSYLRYFVFFLALGFLTMAQSYGQALPKLPKEAVTSAKAISEEYVLARYDYDLLSVMKRLMSEQDFEEFREAWQREIHLSERTKVRSLLRKYNLEHFPGFVNAYHKKNIERMNEYELAVVADFYYELSDESGKLWNYRLEELDTSGAFFLYRYLVEISSQDYSTLRVIGREREATILYGMLFNHTYSEAFQDRRSDVFPHFITSLKSLAEEGDVEGVRLALLAALTNKDSTQNLKARRLRGRGQGTSEFSETGLLADFIYRLSHPSHLSDEALLKIIETGRLDGKETRSTVLQRILTALSVGSPRTNLSLQSLARRCAGFRRGASVFKRFSVK